MKEPEPTNAKVAESPPDTATPDLHGKAGYYRPWTPFWLARPGHYPELVRREIGPIECAVWRYLHSYHHAQANHQKVKFEPYRQPCFASWESIGEGVGVGRKRVYKALKRLTDAALVVEIKQGWKPNARELLPYARWAVCPFMIDLWGESIGSQIDQLAEGQRDPRQWLLGAQEAYEATRRRNQRLRTLLDPDGEFADKTRPKPGRTRPRPSRSAPNPGQTPPPVKVTTRPLPRPAPPATNGSRPAREPQEWNGWEKHTPGPVPDKRPPGYYADAALHR